MRTKAFTLIELLVVIAIIAVLMAILMPSLRAAKDHAKRIHCVSNVKTLSLAWFLYKDENDDKLVGGHVGPDMWVLSPADNATIEQKKTAIRQGLLYEYTGNTLDVYRCPADLRQKDPRQYAFRSFSIAGGANGEGWQDTYEQAKTYSDIRKPSTKYVFLEDIDPRGFNTGSWVMHFGPLSWVDPLAMWHNEKSTFGFADGHSEMHRWYNKSFIDWSLEAMFGAPASFSFNMTPPANEMNDIQYMGRGYPCKSHN